MPRREPFQQTPIQRHKEGFHHRRMSVLLLVVSDANRCNAATRFSSTIAVLHMVFDSRKEGMLFRSRMWSL